MQGLDDTRNPAHLHPSFQEMGDYLRIGGNNIAGFKLRVVRVECGWRACLVVRACNGSVGHAYDNEQDGKAHDEVDE